MLSAVSHRGERHLWQHLGLEGHVGPGFCATRVGEKAGICVRGPHITSEALGWEPVLRLRPGMACSSSKWRPRPSCLMFAVFRTFAVTS